MDLHDLDDITRTTMLDELERDVAAGALYLGRRLNDHGQAQWPEILAEALRYGSPESLASAIRAKRLLVEIEVSHRGGTPYEKKVPVSAAETLAEGEFGRFYMRALCIRAVTSGTKVQVYRAKMVGSPRPESEAMIGQVLDPARLLDDLRSNVGIETFLGLSRPNSGLSVRLV